MVLWGKNSFFPLCALSKKQGCVSHSTSEAEVVALNSIERTMLIPSLDLWETILKKKVLPIVYEDKQATAKIRAAETAMINELREKAASLAAASAAQIITSKLDDKAGLALIDEAAGELEKLN